MNFLAFVSFDSDAMKNYKGKFWDRKLEQECKKKLEIAWTPSILVPFMSKSQQCQPIFIWLMVFLIYTHSWHNFFAITWDVSTLEVVSNSPIRLPFTMKMKRSIAKVSVSWVAEFPCLSTPSHRKWTNLRAVLWLICKSGNEKRINLSPTDFHLLKRIRHVARLSDRKKKLKNEEKLIEFWRHKVLT